MAHAGSVAVLIGAGARSLRSTASCSNSGLQFRRQLHARHHQHVLDHPRHPHAGGEDPRDGIAGVGRQGRAQQDLGEADDRVQGLHEVVRDVGQHIGTHLCGPVGGLHGVIALTQQLVQIGHVTLQLARRGVLFFAALAQLDDQGQQRLARQRLERQVGGDGGRHRQPRVATFDYPGNRWAWWCFRAVGRAAVLVF